MWGALDGGRRWDSRPQPLPSVGPKSSDSAPLGLSVPSKGSLIERPEECSCGHKKGTQLEKGDGAVEVGSSHPDLGTPGPSELWPGNLQGCSSCGWGSEENRWEGRCQAVLCPQCVLEGTLGRTVPSSAPVPTMGHHVIKEAAAEPDTELVLKSVE